MFCDALNGQLFCVGLWVHVVVSAVVSGDMSSSCMIFVLFFSVVVVWNAGDRCVASCRQLNHFFKLICL